MPAIKTNNFFGSVADPVVAAQLVQALKQPKQWVVYMIHENGTKRTEAQNRLFRVVLRSFAQRQGRSVQYWRDYLVERFLGYDEVVTEDGDIRFVLPSTAGLSVSEFTEFLNACMALAAENQIN